MSESRVAVRLIESTLVVPFSVTVGEAVVTGDIRPAAATELEVFLAARAAVAPAARTAVEAEFLAAHLKATNLDGPAGGPLPLDAGTLAKLPPLLLDALLAVAQCRTGVALLGKSASPSGC